MKQECIGSDQRLVKICIRQEQLNHVYELLWYAQSHRVCYDWLKNWTRLSEPRWMNQHGRIVEDEKDSFECKVKVQLEHPDMAIVVDEVGCNTPQECDNAVGGEQFWTGKVDHAYHSVVTHHNHFTVLGLTALDGSPVSCVVILSGKKAKNICYDRIGLEWHWYWKG